MGACVDVAGARMRGGRRGNVEAPGVAPALIALVSLVPFIPVIRGACMCGYMLACSHKARQYVHLNLRSEQWSHSELAWVLCGLIRRAAGMHARARRLCMRMELHGV